MTRPAILVDDIGKMYRIGRDARNDTFREALFNALKSPLRRLRDPRDGGAGTEDFWALKGVSFEVRPGEVVGLIGRNGAGKSTLLKILSRITEPTEGCIRMRGRLASLLEVGTGFHPDLTGRENVYLSGSMLGMARAEIDRKFDEIVAFAGTERFLDTQVKHYSSGMYVRLAFAVAAHLDPEILIIDEVLAVGDANYQKKCMDRIAALAGMGRTILFVSHSMELIHRLCDRAVFLDAGRVEMVGPAEAVTRKYLEATTVEFADVDLAEKPRSGNGLARFTRIQLVDEAGRPLANHVSGDDFIVQFGLETEHEIPDVSLSVCLNTIHGATVVSSWNKEVGYPVDLRRGRHSFRCRFREIRLRPGHQVVVSLWAASEEVIDYVRNAAVYGVVDGEGSGGLSNRLDQSIIVLPYEYTRVESRETAAC
jgi:lipopolysaccharide transport system ATP-binding protein